MKILGLALFLIGLRRLIILLLLAMAIAVLQQQCLPTEERNAQSRTARPGMPPDEKPPG